MPRGHIGVHTEQVTESRFGHIFRSFFIIIIFGPIFLRSPLCGQGFVSRVQGLIIRFWGIKLRV